MAGKGGKNPGAGRPKGSQNKLTADIKEAIEHAFRAIGGEEDLAIWAAANRNKFYTLLLTKLLPKDVKTTFRHVTDANQLTDDQLALIATGGGADIAEAEPEAKAPSDKSQLN